MISDDEAGCCGCIMAVAVMFVSWCIGFVMGAIVF